MRRRANAWATCAVLGLVWGGCAVVAPARLQTGRASLPSAWRPVELEGEDVAMHHVDGGTLTARVSCLGSDQDASLDVLTNHLLMALDQLQEHSREPLELDGRAAMRTRASVALDGVPVELDLVVLKKDGCVVDAQLVAPPEKMPAREPDFDRFVTGLAMSRSEK
jgi:hypothetical protein